MLWVPNPVSDPRQSRKAQAFANLVHVKGGLQSASIRESIQRLTMYPSIVLEETTLVSGVLDLKHQLRIPLATFTGSKHTYFRFQQEGGSRTISRIRYTPGSTAVRRANLGWRDLERLLLTP
jgi:hypothetical protein